MKTVKEIRNIITKLSNELSELDAKEKEITNKIHEIIGSVHFSMPQDKKEAVEALHIERDNLYKAEAMPSKLVKVWQYNLFLTIWAEFMPVFKAVMEKYQGKNIGEKTKEKIRNEFNAAGYSAYFYQEYSRTQIHVSTLDRRYDRFDFYSYNNPVWDDNGKFIMPDLDAFTFDGKTIGYIDNPKRYIKDIEKLAVKLHDAAGIYAEAMENYNKHAIKGARKVEYQNSPKSTFEYFRVWN